MSICEVTVGLLIIMGYLCDGGSGFYGLWS